MKLNKKALDESQCFKLNVSNALNLIGVNQIGKLLIERLFVFNPVRVGDNYIQRADANASWVVIKPNTFCA